MDVAGREPFGHAGSRWPRHLGGHSRAPQGETGASGSTGPLERYDAVRYNATDRSRHRVRRGPAQQCLCDKPGDRQTALEQALQRHQRRAKRAGARRWPSLRRDGWCRVCPLTIGRPTAVDPESDEASQQFVDVAPVYWHRLVIVSTVGFAPLGRGVIYALDARTGAVRWRFQTVEHPWPHPWDAGGGGIWYPVSIDAQGRLYAGTSNPTPWGGTPKLPNGGAFPGPVRYTDSLVVLDARTGRRLWYDQVTPHDVRDYDFSATPILAKLDGAPMVFGAGKAGLVIAWNRRTRRRVWTTPVGLRRNASGPLPRRRVTVCPGIFGGVETPMAYGGGRLFVPDVDLCVPGSATTSINVDKVVPSHGRGRLLALDARTQGTSSGTTTSPHQTSAAQRCPTTSCSRQPTQARCTRWPPPPAGFSGASRCRAGSTAVRRCSAIR